MACCVRWTFDMMHFSYFNDKYYVAMTDKQRYQVSLTVTLQEIEWYQPLLLVLEKSMQGNYLLPLQPGDDPDTYANVDELVEQFGYKPSTTVEEGVRRFVEWYRDYFKV